LLSIDGGSGESIFVMLDGKLSMDDVSKIINSSETKRTQFPAQEIILLQIITHLT
jgi:hypothetical protein